MGTLLTIPALLIAVGAIFGGALTGFFWLIGIFGKTKNQNTKDAEKANQYVIKSLQQQITELEKRISEATQSLKDTNERLDGLQKENKSLREVLQGRDADTKRFQEMGFKIMSEAETQKDMGPKILAVVTQTSKNIERLYQAIEKHLIAMEKQQVVTVTTGGVPNTLE